MLLDFGLRHASRVRVAGSWIWSPNRAGAVCLEPVGWLHTCEMDMELFANASLSVVVEKCWFLGFVVKQNFYVFSLYRNPDLEDQIFLFFTNMNGCRAG